MHFLSVLSLAALAVVAPTTAAEGHISGAVPFCSHLSSGELG